MRVNLKQITQFKILLIIFFLTAPTSSMAQSASAFFAQLLLESNLRFDLPPGFSDIKPEANSVLQYERALRHQSGQLEMRFVIRPLGRIAIDYNDPHNAEPEANYLFPLLFESLITSLSRGGNTPRTTYSATQAHTLFNAGWAAVSVLDVSAEFSAYDQALLVAIHKDNLADAYTIFLYNEYSQAKELITSTLATLSFTPDK